MVKGHAHRISDANPGVTWLRQPLLKGWIAALGIKQVIIVLDRVLAPGLLVNIDISLASTRVMYALTNWRKSTCDD